MISRIDLLSALSRNELLEFVDALSLDVAERRAKGPLVEALAKTKSKQLAEVLSTLPRTRLKELCVALGLDDSGKEKSQLVDRLLPKTRAQPSAPPSAPAPAPRSAPPPQRASSAPMTTNISQLAAYIWNLADLLRGDFKQSQYGRIILPFTIPLRRVRSHAL